MFGCKILIYTPLLKWYIDHGVEIKSIYSIMKFKPKACFNKFADDVSNGKRAGDVDPNKKIIAETMKLFGNSGYGYTVMNKDKHTNITYCSEEKINKHVNDPLFQDCNDLAGETYEIMKSKRKIKMDLPLQIGCAVYQLAKLRMLEFYYDFIDYYIDRADFEYCEMDTDSAYIAFSDPNILNLIKKDKLVHFKLNKEKWLLSTDKETKIYLKEADKNITMAAYDLRTPGKFKEEFVAVGIVALCSKMYYCWNKKGKDKHSSKGINKRQNIIDKNRFMKVLNSKKSDTAINKGFRVKNHIVQSYQQEKVGVSYYFDKRVVLEDGRTTTYTNV